jgi:hypothetical protein
LANNGKKSFKKIKKPLPLFPSSLHMSNEGEKKINFHPSCSIMKEIKINK